MLVFMEVVVALFVECFTGFIDRTCGLYSKDSSSCNIQRGC